MNNKDKYVKSSMNKHEKAIQRGLDFIAEFFDDSEVKPSVVGFAPAWFMEGGLLYEPNIEESGLGE